MEHICAAIAGGGAPRSRAEPAQPRSGQPGRFSARRATAPRRAGSPATRASDRYGAWVSEPGPVTQGMAIRPATIEDAGEVVRLAALMYEAMGLDVTGTALGFGPGANPGLRIRW